jgi:hypothetical protein
VVTALMKRYPEAGIRDLRAQYKRPQIVWVRYSMNRPISSPDTPAPSVLAAWVAIGAAATVLLLLAALHVLSPEFDPSFRVVSEYANGRYRWVLSLMFVAWALSSWALAIAIWSELDRVGGKIALGFLIAAGVGEAMAWVFDIHHPLHNLAGMLGVLSLPTAAMLISVRLGRTPAWLGARKALLWTANLTWAILVLMFAALFVMIRGYTLAGYRIVFVGWANRLLVVLYCTWVMTVAIQALKRRRPLREPHDTLDRSDDRKRTSSDT